MSHNPVIMHCGSCKARPGLPEISKSDESSNMLYRVSCTCGQASPQWSASPSGAIRLWNTIMADSAE